MLLTTLLTYPLGAHLGAHHPPPCRLLVAQETVFTTAMLRRRAARNLLKDLFTVISRLLLGNHPQFDRVSNIVSVPVLSHSQPAPARVAFERDQKT